jgi:hypothetical protein
MREEETGPATIDFSRWHACVAAACVMAAADPAGRRAQAQ